MAVHFKMRCDHGPVVTHDAPPMFHVKQSQISEKSTPYVTFLPHCIRMAAESAWCGGVRGVLGVLGSFGGFLRRFDA
jgi:hypothetical protein